VRSEGLWYRRAAVLVCLVVTLALMAVGAAGATDETGDAADTELILRGQEVYTVNCAACHQADGRGVAGAFPALIDNPNIQDTAYVEQVIRNGSAAVRDPEANSGNMIAFATLSDDDVAAVIAYLQAGLELPGGGAAAPPPQGEVAGTELPFATVITMTLGFLAFVAVAAVVAGPYVLARDDRHRFDWPRAWLKAVVIFLFFMLATVVLPSVVLQWGPVTRAPRIVQDLIGSGIWFVALGVGLYALWRGQRERVL
jgi:mono/diheme cytochrome c family protein